MSLDFIYNALAFFVFLFTFIDVVILIKLYTDNKMIDKIAMHFWRFIFIFIFTLMLWCAFILLGIYLRN